MLLFGVFCEFLRKEKEGMNTKRRSNTDSCCKKEKTQKAIILAKQSNKR